MRPFFALEEVLRRYREERTGAAVEALRVERLAVAPGETAVVCGANGAGKSTLLELCAGLQRPDRGAVTVDGAVLWQDGRGTLAARRKAPMLLQKTVLFSGSVLRNALYGLHARGVRGGAARQRADAALDAVGMLDLAQRHHDELSCGEARRVALARILALEAPALVLDEPTAGLDRDSEIVVEELIARLGRQERRTILIATHDRRQAEALATRIVTLAAGAIESEERR
jgi:energy-coupling factor transporter ATP-binding protein EcfA2